MYGVFLCIYTMSGECVFTCLVHVLCVGLWFVHVLLVLGACLCVCVWVGVLIVLVPCFVIVWFVIVYYMVLCVCVVFGCLVCVCCSYFDDLHAWVMVVLYCVSLL